MLPMPGRTGPGVRAARLAGDSGRGRDGLVFFPYGEAALPGPTDWLKFGVGGVKL